MTKVVKRSSEDNGAPPPPRSELLDTRAVVILTLAMAGAYAASQSVAWAVGIATFGALLTLLGTFVRR